MTAALAPCPSCGHVLHDIAELDDPRPRCCSAGCPCGARCTTCHDSARVCQHHPGRPWEPMDPHLGLGAVYAAAGCRCGPPAPCPTCIPAAVTTGDHPHG